jgi:hypothetical protein
MSKKRLFWLGIPGALVLGIQSACAQVGPTSGLYQITSGRSIACCGFAGPLVAQLPTDTAAFVQLTVDLPSHSAQVQFLGQDMHTVLSIPAQESRNEFTYAFTNGIILADHIQFGAAVLPPMPDQPAFSFVISNSQDTLTINGAAIVPCPGCADIPTEFTHTNVLAVAMPTATIRVSAVDICWNTVSNRTYQAQYRSTVTTNAWVDLGSRVVGNGLTNCLTDQVPLGQPQRYYRVLSLP